MNEDYGDVLRARLERARIRLARASAKIFAARQWEKKCQDLYYRARTRQTVAESWEEMGGELARARAVIARAETEHYRIQLLRAQYRVERAENYYDRLILQVRELEYRLNMW